MANRRSIGKCLADRVNFDCSADQISVDPAIDGSRSNRPIKIITKRKLRTLQAMNGT